MLAREYKNKTGLKEKVDEVSTADTFGSKHLIATCRFWIDVQRRKETPYIGQLDAITIIEMHVFTIILHAFLSTSHIHLC